MIYTVSANPALDLTLTVPEIEYDTVLRATEVRRDVAGKGFNVSIFLKTLGVENVAMAFVAGHTGQALEDGLHNLGIATDFIYVEGETRTNVVVREPAGRRHIKVNQPGATVTVADYQHFQERVGERADAGDLFILTGSLAPGLPVTFYGELIELLHSHGATVILDSSGQALTHGCAAKPAWAKPNTVEAAEFTGRPCGNDSGSHSGAHRFFGRRRATGYLVHGSPRRAGGGPRWHLASPAAAGARSDRCTRRGCGCGWRGLGHGTRADTARNRVLGGRGRHGHSHARPPAGRSMDRFTDDV